MKISAIKADEEFSISSFVVSQISREFQIILDELQSDNALEQGQNISETLFTSIFSELTLQNVC